MIQIDMPKLESLVGVLAGKVSGCCCAASAFVGVLNDGKVVKVSVLAEDEADEEGFNGISPGTIVEE